MRADLFAIPFEHLKPIVRSAFLAGENDHMHTDEGAKMLFRHEMHNAFDASSRIFIKEELLNNDCI